ncbi:MAG TPA: hypothetical protein DEP05_10345 [Betaproteobacteria bacterium]|nr:hypothetical protein [Betaproteobacteria bacterium]
MPGGRLISENRLALFLGNPASAPGAGFSMIRSAVNALHAAAYHRFGAAMVLLPTAAAMLRDAWNAALRRKRTVTPSFRRLAVLCGRRPPLFYAEIPRIAAHVALFGASNGNRRHGNPF